MKTLPLVRLVHLHADRKYIRIADFAKIRLQSRARFFLLALITAQNFMLPGKTIQDMDLHRYDWEESVMDTVRCIAMTINRHFRKRNLPVRVVIGEKSS